MPAILAKVLNCVPGLFILLILPEPGIWHPESINFRCLFFHQMYIHLRKWNIQAFLAE